MSCRNNHAYYQSILSPDTCGGKAVVERVFTTACLAPNQLHNTKMVYGLPYEDCLFHIMLLWLGKKLTKSENKLLVAILCFHCYRGQSICVPLETNDFCCNWIGHLESGQSIYNNLPIPDPIVPTERNGYSYMSIESIIKINMASNFRAPVPFKDFVDSPHDQCERAKEWFSVAKSLLVEDVNKNQTLPDATKFYIKVVMRAIILKISLII